MKQFVYILTDSNRKSLHVGLTHDLAYTMNYYKEMHSLFFDGNKKASRLVYFEELISLELALERFKDISLFTRLQKEKLIRLINNNWKDLSIQPYATISLKNGSEQYERLVSAS
jgi:putative endonuclease